MIIYRPQAETVATDLKEVTETNEDASGLGATEPHLSVIIVCSPSEIDY